MKNVVEILSAKLFLQNGEEISEFCEKDGNIEINMTHDWLTDCTTDVDNRKNVLQVVKYDINIMDDAVESFLQSMCGTQKLNIHMCIYIYCVYIYITLWNSINNWEIYQLIVEHGSRIRGQRFFLSSTGWI